MAAVQKYLLFLFNLIFVLLGLAIIVVGALLHGHNQDFDILVPKDESIPFFSVGTILIVVGVVIFIVAFTGCCGAIKESTFLLSIFIFLLFLVLIVEIAAVVLGFLYSGEVESTLTDSLLRALDQYTPGVNGTFELAWDGIQTTGDCCGVNGFADWSNNGSFVVDQYPASCLDKASVVFPRGCKAAIIDPIKSNLLACGICALVVVFVELIGIMFACCLVKSVREKGETA